MDIYYNIVDKDMRYLSIGFGGGGSLLGFWYFFVFLVICL